MTPCSRAQIWVRVDRNDAPSLPIQIERTLYDLSILRQNLDGHASLATVSSLSDVLNFAGEDGDKFVEPSYRASVRGTLLNLVEFTVLTSMQPMTVSGTGHALSAIGNIMGRPEDVSQESVELALDLVFKLLADVIGRVGRGDIIPIIDDIKRHARSSVSGIRCVLAYACAGVCICAVFPQVYAVLVCCKHTHACVHACVCACILHSKTPQGQRLVCIFLYIYKHTHTLQCCEREQRRQG
jgi:hypothetical protein